MPWAPGDTVVLREIWRGRIWTARPVVVVEDAPGRMIFHIPVGTVLRYPLLPSGEWQRVPSGDWTLGDRTWDGSRVLSFAWPDVAHAALLLWEAGTDAFAGWYVNLQEPLRRTPIGFDTVDHVLDLEVAPDRTWSWKDEDELERCVELGLHTREGALEIRREGERAIARLEAGEEPFDDAWLDWRPDPSWGVPELPPGWDEVGPSGRGAR